MKLYWVTTEDHCEDWFIVSHSAKAAERFHEINEGYSRGEASAEEILTIPSDLNPEPGWPTDELIHDLGGVFVSQEHPRIVQLNNKKYCEGLLEGIIREIDDKLDLEDSDQLSDVDPKISDLH
jgi:hypothetical protein